jgi:DNA-binding transcriptional MerR regulator
MESIPALQSDFLVIRGDAFEELVYTYMGSEGGQKTSAFLQEKRFTVKEADITYRVANHWESVGLIDNERTTDQGWRKYSILDLVWLRLISDMRQLGVPIEVLSSVKKSLESKFIEDRLDKHKRRVALLEIYIAAALVYGEVVYLVVLPDGRTEPMSYTEYVNTLPFAGIGHHVHISISHVLQRLFPKLAVQTNFKSTISVADDELELIFLLRTGNYETITVRGKDGRIESFEVEQHVATEKRIVELLQEGKYQDIEIKQRDGRIVGIKRTIKKKIPNDTVKSRSTPKRMR